MLLCLPMLVDSLERLFNGIDDYDADSTHIEICRFFISLFGFLCFKKRDNSSYQDFNLRSLYLLSLTWFLDSLRVYMSFVMSHLYHYNVCDPLFACIYIYIIYTRVYPLIKTTGYILVQSLPEHISMAEEFRQLIRDRKICAYRDLHLWKINETDTMGTVCLYR
eukprot:UN07054